MYDSFDANKCGGDELDNTRFIVRSVHIFGTNWLREAIVGYSVFLDEVPIKAVDWGSAVDEGFGDDVFIKGVFEDR